MGSRKRDREKWGTGKWEGVKGRGGWQGLNGGNKGDSQELKSGKYERIRTHDQPHSRRAS